MWVGFGIICFMSTSLKLERIIIQNKTSSPNDYEFTRFDYISTLAKNINGYLCLSNGYINHKGIFGVH